MTGSSGGARRAGLTVMMAVALAVGVAGCSRGPSPSPSATPSSSGSAPSATPTPKPTLVKDGTANQNLPYFDAVNQQTIAANPSPVGATFVNGLAAAGFDKAAMQVTQDKTSVGLEPGSIQFSVKLGDSCLIGQYGSDIGGYHSMVAAPISTGACLVGQTVPIQ